MKKFAIIITTISLFVSLVASGHAQTPTKKPAPTSQEKTQVLSEQINDLKEKIASRVAQLDLVEKRGIVGAATEIEDTQLTLTDIYRGTRFIDVDEITEFSSDDEGSSFGISDIDQNATISVLGLYNKQSGRILARFIQTATLPVFVTGKITALNEDDFAATIQGSDSVSYTVDIETSTTTREYDGEDFVKSGFSQLEIGQTVFVTGFTDEDEPTNIAAERLLVFSPVGESDVTPTPEE